MTASPPTRQLTRLASQPSNPYRITLARLRAPSILLSASPQPLATMPRPPRAKVAPKTATTTRVAKPAARKPLAKAASKPTAKQTRTASAALNSFSEDSDSLVAKSRSSRSKRGAPRQQTPEAADEVDLQMTGALPLEEVVSVSATKTRTPVSNASTVRRSTRGSARVSAKKALPVDDSPAQTNSPAQDASELALEGDSGFGDFTMSSLDANSPEHGTRPPSAVKVGATPAHETSILALTNFKRRARQPSLLRMVQQTTDVEDNDQDDLDNTDNFDFDDFLPQDESTPINVRKNAAEKEVANDSGAHLSSPGTRKSKRKSAPVVQVPRSSPPFEPPSGVDVGSDRSPSPSLPDVVESHEEVVEQTQTNAEPLSETAAPPMSSSPPRELSTPPAQTRVSRRGRAIKKPVQDDYSSAEETETPARAKRRAKGKAQQSISTAQLKDLLPRRRNRMPQNRDEFDVESSEEVTQMDSDADELQMPNRRTRTIGGSKTVASPKASKKTGRGKKTGAVSKPGPKSSRTYSRRISSEKENHTRAGEREAAMEQSPVEVSEKLAAIRRKFEAIDDFELEFETVDGVTTSSSPYR
jgi:hypothetical protein